MNYNEIALRFVNIYQAMYLHFSTDYDYFRYNGALKYEITDLEKRKDRNVLKRLVLKMDKWNTNDVLLFLAANFIKTSPKCPYTSDLIDIESFDEFEKLKNDMKSCYDPSTYNIDNIKEYVNWECDDHPDILEDLFLGRLNFIQFAVFDSVFDLIDRYKYKKDNFMWNIYKNKYIKFKGFFNIDSEMAKRTIYDIHHITK